MAIFKKSNAPSTETKNSSLLNKIFDFEVDTCSESRSSRQRWAISGGSDTDTDTHTDTDTDTDTDTVTVTVTVTVTEPTILRRLRTAAAVAAPKNVKI